jgi:hypothetical protein
LRQGRRRHSLRQTPAHNSPLPCACARRLARRERGPTRWRSRVGARHLQRWSSGGGARHLRRWSSGVAGRGFIRRTSRRARSLLLPALSTSSARGRAGTCRLAPPRAAAPKCHRWRRANAVGGRRAG